MIFQRPAIFFLVFLLSALYFSLLKALAADGGWASSDAINYHLPQISTFVSGASVLEYEPSSATTPYFHIIAACWYRFISIFFPFKISASTTVLNIAISSATVAMLFSIFLEITKSIKFSSLTILPIASTQYFFLPSIYPVTEALSYFGMVLTLYSYVFFLHSRFFAFLSSLGFIFLTSRQIFLPVLVAHIMMAHCNAKFKNTLILVVGAPLFLFAPLFFSWGALVPPEFSRHESNGFNFLPVLHAFSLHGLLFTPYALISALPTIESVKLRTLTIVCAVSLFPSLYFFLPNSIPNEQTGSIIWKLQDFISGSEYFLFPLFLFSSFGLYQIIAAAIVYRSDLLRYFGLIIFLYYVALGGQEFAWQRYSEVTSLIYLSLSACFFAKNGERVQRRGAYSEVVFGLTFLSYGLLSIVWKIL